MNEARGGQPILVCFTPFVPYAGVTHAGGEFLLHHLQMLSARFDIYLVAPLDEQNPLAAEIVPTWIRRVRVVHYAPGRLGRMRAILHKALLGTAYDPAYERVVRRDEEIRGWVRSAQAVDFEWTQSAVFAGFVRRLNPGARLVLVVHDILTQRWLRSRKMSPRLPMKVYYAARGFTAFLAERRRFAKVDHVVAFSDGDAERARRIRPGAHVVAVSPPRLGATMAHSVPELRCQRSGRLPGEVLFVGAMNRPENDDAALWFLDNVWLNVLADYPTAHLTIAGANPSQRLLQRCSGAISVTGEVPSLLPYYARASVFVAPLRLGAGVKFKVIDAMVSGVPVVSTSVGAEGIGDESHYIGLTDDPDEFAHKVVLGLHNELVAQVTAERAFEWAIEMYGPRRLAELGEVLYA